MYCVLHEGRQGHPDFAVVSVVPACHCITGLKTRVAFLCQYHCVAIVHVRWFTVSIYS